MTAVLLGLAAVPVGLLLCLRGAGVLRLLMALWGALAGFILGSGTVAAVTGDTFLAGALALVVAVVAGAVAYTFYAVAILVAMAAFGFTLGTDVMVALGVRWSWLIIAAGVVFGVTLAAVAVMGDLPMFVLVLISALAGASTVVTGLMLMFGTVSLDGFTSPVTTQRLDDGWWWYLLYTVLAVAGCVVQLRSLQEWRAPLRSQWGPSPARGAVGASPS